MLDWPRDRGLRKRPKPSIMEKVKKGRAKVKSAIMVVVNYLLLIVNLMFIVSWIFQELRASDGNVEYEPVAVQEIIEKQTKIIQIEVLNGCGVNKLAQNLTNFLRDIKDFDVVDYKDYERYDIPETLVIDRKSMDMRYAKIVANKLGVKSTNILPQLNQARNSDVSIIIGADYNKLKAFN